jgi:hypothetical protein
MQYPLLRTVLMRPPDAVAAFTDSATDTTDATAYTFTAKAIGAAAADRFVIVAAGGSQAGTHTIASLTIGGISARQVVTEEGNGGGENVRIAFWGAPVPTGATADIVVTFNAGMRRCGIGVWSVTGLRSLDPRAAITSQSSTASVDLPILPGGFVIGYSQIWISATASSFTWTGLTENFDAAWESNNTHSGALISSTTDTRVAITSTPANVATAASHIFASFR